MLKLILKYFSNYVLLLKKPYLQNLLTFLPLTTFQNPSQYFKNNYQLHLQVKKNKICDPIYIYATL